MFLVMIVCSFVAGDVSSFLGRDFSSELFFIEVFLQIFGRELSLERFFGRDFSSYF